MLIITFDHEHIFKEPKCRYGIYYKWTQARIKAKSPVHNSTVNSSIILLGRLLKFFFY
jgi:hypothetical protein